MRIPTLLVCLGIACGLTGPATATPTAFSGTLSVAIANLPPIRMVADGVADVTRSGGVISAIALSGGTFATTVTIPVTDPASAPITQLVADLTSGAGAFYTIPGGTIANDFVTDLTGTGSGAMAVSGAVKIGLFSGPLADLTVPFTSGGVNGVGVGGDTVSSFGSGVGITVRGAPWTTETAALITPGGVSTAMGLVAGNTVQLVSPTYISTTINVDVPIPSFAFLTLTFAPEPGTLLLLCGGLACLAICVRKRGRG